MFCAAAFKGGPFRMVIGGLPYSGWLPFLPLARGLACTVSGERATMSHPSACAGASHRVHAGADRPSVSAQLWSYQDVPGVGCNTPRSRAHRSSQVGGGSAQMRHETIDGAVGRDL